LREYYEHWENIDQHFTQIKVAAKQQSRKVHVGQVPWSPILMQAIYKVLYWKGIQKWILGGKISSTVLKKGAVLGVKKFHLGHLSLQREEITKKIKGAIQDYQVVKKQKDRRETWVNQMIAAQAEAQNTMKAKLWKRLWQTEQSCSTSRRVKQVLGDGAIHTGLCQVTAPVSEEDPGRVTITTKQELEVVCLEEAQQHFTQAANMPMLQPPMFDLVGIDNVDSPAFQQILDGTFVCPQDCDPYLHKLIPYLAQPEGIPEITIRIYDKYKCSWEWARETTASSPLTIHFGHYIAGVANEVVGKLNLILANMRLASGTAPTQWKKMLNIMPEKLAGNDNMEKLRIIMLFEADFNHNNKWLGRVTMQSAEAQKLLAPEQYGSWKNKAART